MSAKDSKDTAMLLAGNEAIALGVYEAGVKVASAYPGTPSTEILENLVKYEGVYCEWAPNEKVALEVAIGASLSGVRALCTMKHVGLNVAADPFFTASYTGVRGGLVIVNADDPEMHSSQNEQDNRNYAYAAKVPMLEPSDANEAKEFIKLGYEISEEFDTPVVVRTTTRVAHVKGLAHKGKKATSSATPGIVKDPQKMVMLPGHARMRRVEVEKRTDKLKEFAGAFEFNSINKGDSKIGFITAGVSYLYVKEAFPEASVLKLGMVWPLNEKLIKDFAATVEQLYIVEELDPFLETHIKAMGVECKGKELVPAIGELNADKVRAAITGQPTKSGMEPVADIPMRPPNMCPGCPHRGTFHAIRKLKLFVSGDIGCYTLGALPPLKAMDMCVCMGASVSMAHGIDKALGNDALGKAVAVIGDSTFFHSGITGLMDIVYNKGVSTVIILDNRITAMTGQQENPSSGMTLMGDKASEVDIEALCKAIGVKRVVTVNPHEMKATEEAIKAEVQSPEPSVVIARAPCVLIPIHRKKIKDKYKVDRNKCVACKQCLSIGCPAVQWVDVTPEEAKALGYKEKQKGHSMIDSVMCDGCSQCFQLCKFGALTKEGQ